MNFITANTSISITGERKVVRTLWLGCGEGGGGGWESEKGYSLQPVGSNLVPTPINFFKTLPEHTHSDYHALESIELSAKIVVN